MSNYERSLKKSKEPSWIGNPNHHQSIHECTIDIQKKIQVSINTPDLCKMFWQNWDFFNYLRFITKDLLIRLLGSLKLKYHFLVIYYWSIIQYFGVFISTWGDGKATRSWITSPQDRIPPLISNVRCSFLIYVFMHELWAELLLIY